MAREPRRTREFGMKVVCSYCHRLLRESPGEAVGVSHGMCPECDAYFAKLWGGLKLGEYLDLLPVPVMVVDGGGRVVAASERLADVLHRPRAELRGLRCGEAMACSRSRLPGGCGKAEHCRECTIRRTVDEVHETGRSVAGARAWVKTDAGRVPVTISARPAQGFVEVTLDEPEALAGALGGHAPPSRR
ncbi:PAS domain-containing protein [Anaeromyxobacter dehalogenans]|nr:PAS domain-containing protein [Anaeromyxobacter dehalogenans]